MHIVADAQLSISPRSVSFTPGNWRARVSVRVRSVDDLVAEGMHGSLVRHNVSTPDASYRRIAALRLPRGTAGHAHRGVAQLQATINDTDVGE